MRVGAIEYEIPADYQQRALQEGWALQRAWHRARLDLVEHLLPPDPAALSLDAAAGSGILALRFAPAPIVSTDIRLDACAVIRSHGSHSSAASANLSALPFRDGAFDRVYLLEVLEHLTPDDGLTAARQLMRVCRTGGRCLITTPNYGSHWSILERTIDRLKLTPAMAGEQHVTRFTSASLGTLMREAGWSIVRQGSFNLFAPIAGVFSRRAGSRALRLELDLKGNPGALLFALCERPAA